MNPLVSIVGRPNVGKSTLFNRLVGERKAIVHNLPGVTRDRHYGDSYWNGKDFTVIDTGGYVNNDDDIMMQGIKDQVNIAIEQSDIVLFVVDIETGISGFDKDIADLLRRNNKPVILVANKSDKEQKSFSVYEFFSLGFDEIFSVSSMTGTGTGELLDRVVELLPAEIVDNSENKYPKIAIVGRPNVGKSSIVNALLNVERSIVTNIAGTTRDSINTIFMYQGKDYELIDTAGLRRKTRVSENIEFYSTVRTQKAIREADIVVLIIDAKEGFEAQDSRILHDAEKFNKGLILVLNKWDLIEKDTKTHDQYVLHLQSKIPDLSYIPIITISALTKQRLFRIMELTELVLEERNKKISTSKFNEFVEKFQSENPLPMARGVALKIKYATQVKVNPPVFSFFMNKPKELPANYRKYIENRLRDEFGFIGVPITMVFKEK